MGTITRTIVIAALTVSVVSMAQARTAKSLNYELEYASVNAGSADTASSNYSIVSIITTDGVAGGKSLSIGGAYTLEPAVGSSITNDETSVHDWALY